MISVRPSGPIRKLDVGLRGYGTEPNQTLYGYNQHRALHTYTFVVAL